MRPETGSRSPTTASGARRPRLRESTALCLRSVSARTVSPERSSASCRSQMASNTAAALHSDGHGPARTMSWHRAPVCPPQRARPWVAAAAAAF